MAMERRRQRLLVAFALAVCALASRTTAAASDEVIARRLFLPPPPSSLRPTPDHVSSPLIQLLRGGRAARDAEEDIVEGEPPRPPRPTSRGCGNPDASTPSQHTQNEFAKLSNYVR